VCAALQNRVKSDQIRLKNDQVCLCGFFLAAEQDILDELDGTVDLVAADAGVDEDVEEDFRAERFTGLV